MIAGKLCTPPPILGHCKQISASTVKLHMSRFSCKVLDAHNYDTFGHR